MPVLQGRYDQPVGLPPAQVKPLHEVVVMNAISLSFGGISLISTIVTLYWFVRMRGTFRHNLIILLVLGDLIKSLWFVIFPIQFFARGNKDPNHIFCQASGFGLALGIEAADCAVFLIAIQVAVSVFHPGGVVGLEPHRLRVYTLWAAVPVLLASLMFIDHGSYTNFGQYCYVPNVPLWRRLMLSWVPRYIIFFSIVSLAVAISIYVRRLLRRYGIEEDSSASSSMPINSGRHDLTLDQIVTPVSPPELTQAPPPAHTAHTGTGTDQRRSLFQSLRAKCFTSSSPTSPRLRPKGATSSTSSSSTRVPPENGPEFHTSRTRAHERIRRQLRQLFVYPLIYLAIWTLPFIVHIIRIYRTTKNSLIVNSLSLLSLNCAGAVDCAVFMTREKPWRSVRAGFWSCLRWRLHIGYDPGDTFQGRSREEMTADAIMAQRRRREEVALERLEPRSDSDGRGHREGGSRGRKNWWEVDGGAEEEEEGEGEDEKRVESRGVF